jgi:tRNA A-37 threonylcarbamoyl transferase component Bud32
MARMDADVLELARDERLIEAAELASGRGQSAEASILFERACDWSRAAREALRAGHAGRALELAAEADDPSTAEQAVSHLSLDARLAEGVAERLAHRSHHAWAARLLEAAGRVVGASRSWERAGDAVRAAVLLESHGDDRGAARILEAALRREPRAWREALALGALLARLGRDEAAVRVVQRVPNGAAERREALAQLAGSLERLGLSHAAREATAELAALGGPGPSTPAFPEHSHGALLFGRYEVVREFASSMTSRTLECVDRMRGDRVALKLLRGTQGEALARFERDVGVVRSLDHTNIVPIRDVMTDPAAIALVWMDGGSLGGMRSQPFAPSRAVEIAYSLLLALGDVHRFGVLHRDVKPENVLFDSVGTARLADFGMAHLADVSATGVLGALAYASPEQRRGHRLTPSSDIFSIGALLHEMLTGDRPSLSSAPRSRPSERHSGLEADHDRAVALLTADDPDARPPSAFEARALLASLRWPSWADPRRRRGLADSQSSPRTAARRLDPPNEEILTPVDTWSGRAVERVPLSDAVLARARAFAAAAADTDHAALQTVIRVDREEGALWLAAVRGHPLDRRLTAEERARLEAALAALHARGVAHGRVDADHIAIEGEAPILRFEPLDDSEATADGDRLALAAL